jgi:hypothetical protein
MFWFDRNTECGVFDVDSMKCVSDDSYVILVVIKSRLYPGHSLFFVHHHHHHHLIGTKFLIARYTPDAWRMRARPKKV